MTKTVNNRLSDTDFNLTKTKTKGAIESKLRQTNKSGSLVDFNLTKTAKNKTSGQSSQDTLVDFNLTKTLNKIPSGKTFKRLDIEQMAN